ncbi:MAG: thioredoxin family protein, partial [Bacteroidales bacterium]|nr:thioredoxin family protein [Bacteroidales bacterium]
SFTVSLRPMVPTDSVSMRWSPKGEKVELKGSGPEWSAELNLGPQESAPVKLLLSATGDNPYPDRLKGDWNRSGSLDDDSVIQIVPKDNRGKIWSSFAAIIDIPVNDPQTGKTTIIPYPLDFWHVYDPVEPDGENVIRYSRRGWMQGSFQADSVLGHILLSEMKMDGVYDTLDSWMLALSDDQKKLYINSRPCNDHAWLGNTAYMISAIDPSGMQVTLTPVDVGMTQEEEAALRDKMAVDRNAAHSGESVAFMHDYMQAKSESAKLNKPMLIDFETTWCGPCAQMNSYVYNADLVVEKSINVVAVKVDGDVHRDLVKQYNVSGYPTIILVGSDGTEIKRAVGYQSVKAMVEFLTF